MLLHGNIGRYRLDRLIGSGSMGEVYRAHDTLLCRDVALKRLYRRPGDTRGSLEAVLAEARAAADLRHPAIVTIHNVFEFRREAFIDEALAPGVSLDGRLSRPVRLDSFFRIASQCAGALAAAEEKGIVHCDLKPANIMLDAKDRVCIVDFGIARRLRTDADPGRHVGSRAYLAPELWKRATGEPTPASDLFSLGVVFYQLLTATHPFLSDDLHVLETRIVRDHRVSMRQLNARVPAAVDALVLSMLSRSPADRPRGASALACELDRLVRITAKRRVAPRGGTRAVARAGAGARGARLALAVPPFQGAVRNVEVAALGAGLAEAVRLRLTGIRSLSVIAPDSGMDHSIAVKGSLRQAHGRLRVRFEVRDHTRGIVIPGGDIEEPSDHISRVEDRLVTGILQLLAREFGIERRSGAKRLPARSESAYRYYLRARGHITHHTDERELIRAIGFLETALQYDSRFAPTYAALGEAYWLRYEITHTVGWKQEAEFHALSALKYSDQDRPELHVTMGMIHLGTGHAEAAAREFRRAIELDARSFRGHVGLAQAEDSLDRIDAAEKAFRAAIKLQPEAWYGHNRLGVHYFRRGRLDDALECFRLVVKLNPRNPRGYENLAGVLLQYPERTGEAEGVLLRSIEIRPTYEAYNNLGHVYHHLGRHEEAAEMFRRAIALDPRDFRVWGSLYASLRSLRRPAADTRQVLRRAADLARKEHEIDPQDPLVRVLLASFLVELGNRAEAERLVEVALAGTPRDVQVLFHSIFVFEHLQERDRALELAERAIELGFPVERFRSDPVFRHLINDPRFPSAPAEARADQN